MNEQNDNRADGIHHSQSDLIYTHRSTSSSIPSQELAAAEAQADTDANPNHDSSHCEKRAARPRRAAQAEGDSGDLPELEEDIIQPIVPPLITFPGDRSNYRHVIKRFDGAYARKPYESGSVRSEALKYFRGCYSSSEWMMEQDGWMENVSLLASIGPFSRNPRRVLYCSACGKLCFQPHLCFRCNLDQCVEPLQKMFEGAYKKRPFWYSLVLNYEMDARQAGIWTGLKENLRPVLLPHSGKPEGQFFRCCPHQLDLMKAFVDFLTHILDCLRKSGIIDGWMAVIEPNVSFWPDPATRFHRWSCIEHAFLPHLHVLVCGPHPLDEKLIRAIYDVLQQFLGTWSYANLWFNPVTSQAGIKQWINYCVKPFPLAKWYKNGVCAGCDQSDLNLLFDDVVLQSCAGIMSRIYSPRRAGVLATNSGNACILQRLPPLLTNEQIGQCKNGQSYHEHEDSFWRTMEKRALRQGRNFRCRTKSHKAAIRRISAWEKQHESP